MLRLAGEVGELAHDEHLRRRHVLEGLLAVVGGCSAVCCEIDLHHDRASGWAIPGSITCAGALFATHESMVDRYLTGQLAALDPAVPHLLRDEHAVATACRADVVDDATWYASAHYNEIRRPLGIGESMYGKFVTPDGRHMKLSVHREARAQPFKAHHARLLNVFNENLARLYVATPPERMPADRSVEVDEIVENLPPRLRPVLRWLLAGDAEKQAAIKLGLSYHTVHEYTKALYRAFGVSSRGELLAKFVVNA